MRRNYPFVFLIFSIGAQYSLCLTVETRKTCCSLGTNYAKSGLDCTTFQPPIAGVQKFDENLCLKVVDVCCKNQVKETQCNLGVADAKSGGNCASSEEGERKVCCEACQMGIDTKKSGESCREFSGLGAPYDTMFVSCCEEEVSSSTAPTTTTKRIVPTSALLRTTAKNEKYPLPSMESLCDSGEVCAQICEPTVDSFICSCNKGFILMEDGVSCRPEKRALKKGGRCEVANPCDQDCLDTGTEVKCSCREGYELAANKRTCLDIDECATGTHDCTKNEECVNEIGTFSCYELLDSVESDVDFDAKCRPGYKFNAENHVCDDIDECQVGLTCPRPKTCVNTMGSFVCEGEDVPQCPPGFHYRAAIESCADIDECLMGENNCNKESQVCLNIKGDYTCVDKKSRCPPGFKKNAITQICEDIDECVENLKACNADEVCVNEPGGHSCAPSSSTNQQTSYTTPSTTPTTATVTQFVKPTERTIVASRPVSCPPGFKYALQLNACLDIDECSEDREACDSTQQCLNTQGSFLCNCKKGFTKDHRTAACVDVNECQMMLHDCTVAERCDNTVGSYHCARITGCGTGYTLNLGNGLCEDNDECKLNTHNCNNLGPNFRCRNLLGSYRCEAVRPTTPRYRTTPSTTRVTPPYSNPYRSNPRYVPPTVQQPKPNYHPSITGQLKRCLPGYRMNARQECEDINECESNPCQRNEVCLNYNGKHQCWPKPCKIGFELNEEGQCVDVNECSRGTHKCNHSQICKNFVGFYACDCPPGHHLNNLTQQCEDKDECKIYNPCGYEADCVNTIGSFKCECRQGFRNVRNMCDDVNECEEGKLCDHKCVNIWGSYKCACKSGFTLQPDNRTCIDMDECEEFKDNNLCIGHCRNTPGSYACECPKGYKLGSDGRACLDIDECLETVCGPEEICVNLRGGHKCYHVECPANYIRDSEHKTRCKRPPTLCDPRDIQCFTLPEQYTYQFLSLVSDLPLYEGHIQLFQVKGPVFPSSRAYFQTSLKDVRCPYGVPKADESYFRKEFKGRNNMQLFLLKSLKGPQEIVLEIKMTFSENDNVRGSAVVYLILLVSEFPY